MVAGDVLQTGESQQHLDTHPIEDRARIADAAQIGAKTPEFNLLALKTHPSGKG